MGWWGGDKFGGSRRRPLSPSQSLQASTGTGDLDRFRWHDRDARQESVMARKRAYLMGRGGWPMRMQFVNHHRMGMVLAVLL